MFCFIFGVTVIKSPIVHTGSDQNLCLPIVVREQWISPLKEAATCTIKIYAGAGVVDGEGVTVKDA